MTARSTIGALGKESLDDPVLERMEGDHHQSGTFGQQLLRVTQRCAKFAELVVDGDPEGLECAGRGVDHMLPPWYCGPHGFRQRYRPGEGPGSDDCPGDPAGVPLLAECVQDVRESALIGFVYDVGGRFPGPGHPHVQRPIRPERESAFRVVELRRRHPEVEDDSPVNSVDVQGQKCGTKAPYSRVHELKSERVPLRQGPSGPERVRVAVNRDHATVGRLEQRRCDAATPEGCIDVERAGAGLQARDDLREENRHVGHGRATMREGGRMGAHVPAFLSPDHRTSVDSLGLCRGLREEIIKQVGMDDVEAIASSQQFGKLGSHGECAFL